MPRLSEIVFWAVVALVVYLVFLAPKANLNFQGPAGPIIGAPGGPTRQE